MPSDNKQKKEKVSSPWKEDEKLESFNSEENDSGDTGVSVFVKVLIPVLILAAIGSGFYYYFFMRVTPPTVVVEFSKPDQILAGQSFPLTVSFSNNSDQVLKNARLSVSLPDKVYYVSGSQDQRIIESNIISDVGPGSAIPNVFNLIVVGDSNALKHIDAKLSYQLNGSTAQFESKNGIDLPISQQAVDLGFEMPQAVFSGSNFDIKVNYKNNSNNDFTGDVILKIDYPSGFQFSKSSVDLSSGKNQWNLGKLSKGTSGSFTITGSLVGGGNSSSDFHGAVSAGGRDFGGQTFTIAEQTGSVSISPSPLSLSLSINGSDNYVAHAGDDLVYNLRYKNDSTTPLENIVVKASLSGEMLDLQTLRTDAAFSATGNTFTWMTANTPALAKLLPGQEGTLSIDIKLKKNFPIRLISDKNFTLKLNAEISSPTVPQGTNASKTFSVASFETKIAGKLQIKAKALWRDAASGILNNGPYPPKVNQPTQYTIHWILTNYSADVSGVQVSAFLQSGARWTGKVKSNTDNQPTYDSSTGKVAWNVGDIMATKGVVGQPVEAIFQIELTPAVNQTGQYVSFLSDTAIQWQDNFVGAQFNDSYPTLNTMLLDDPTIGPNTSRAVQ